MNYLKEIQTLDDKYSGATAGQLHDYMMTKLICTSYYTSSDMLIRINELLEREDRSRRICRTKQFKKLDKQSCPYCGWKHE